ncbi:MAG: Ig-like domain-containing protein [Polyangiaceae bacterium]
MGATLLAGLLAGCTGVSPPGRTGDLGNGVFSYVCDSGSDPVCSEQTVGDLLTMPAAVAVGGRFSLQYTSSPFGDDTGGATLVEPASSALLIQTEAFSSSFEGIKPGVGAILARRGDLVVDFVHLRIEAPDAVRVDRVLPGEDVEPTAASIHELEVEMGSTTLLRGYAVDEAGTALGGAQAVAWTSSNEEVVDFDGGTGGIEAVVRATGAGTATVSVTVGDRVAEVEVTVGGEL